MIRIDKTFAALKSQGRKALITFTMAGDPDQKTALSILEELAKSADILEIGMPFSDPMADGPAIQAAGIRALQQGVNLDEILLLVQQFRSKNLDTPIVLMGYINPILHYGIDKFCNDFSNIGVDGLIIVDLPPEESKEIVVKLQQKNLSLIRLVAPTTSPERLQKILQDASGFLYYVSITGVTGTASADPLKVGTHIAAIKNLTDLPIVAGFGIKTPQDAATMAKIADGVVVGSALVQTIENNQKDPALAQKLGEQASALAKALAA